MNIDIKIPKIAMEIGMLEKSAILVKITTPIADPAVPTVPLSPIPTPLSSLLVPFAIRSKTTG